jgi:type III restriction enzyme
LLKGKGAGGVTGSGSGERPIDLSNPIINSPYEPPQRHFEIGPHGPTGVLLQGR